MHQGAVCVLHRVNGFVLGLFEEGSVQVRIEAKSLTRLFTDSQTQVVGERGYEIKPGMNSSWRVGEWATA